MKKRIPALLAAAAMLLSGCGGNASEPQKEDADIRVLATTYPVYLLTTSLTEDLPGVSVELLVNSETSCLHDYTLTVPDMKAIEAADVIVVNGVGMENFMSDALSHSSAVVIDASADVELLPMEGHHHHDHEHEHAEAEGQEMDPHIWLDPNNAMTMLKTISAGLAQADSRLAPEGKDLLAKPMELLEQGTADMEKKLESLPVEKRKLITFHDGFHYFANAFDMTILKSIEEEEGSEASAADIREIVTLVEENGLPAIFTEKKGSTATADAIVRETGCKRAQLDMMMSGEGTGVETYLELLSGNIDAVVEALA